MVLGVLGAATAAAAQDQYQRAQEAQRKHDSMVEHQVLGHKRQEILRNERNGNAMAEHQYLSEKRQTIMQNQRWGNFQRNVQAQRRFQGGFWRAPPGFAYRRWSYGQVLPGVYLGQNYWINNWAAFGLFAPPPGLVWVRYGPDVLLVDRYTGQIVQVRYGIFY
ncbi:MAG TPA: RcnB family protein [Caulobacteraceae bacterium]|jgi:Ni/Co efflux regulator RcnB